MNKLNRFKKIVTTTLITSLLASSAGMSQTTDIYAQEPSQTGIVAVSALNFRSAASTDASIISCLKKGTVLDIIESKGDWLKVETSVGQVRKTGFVYNAHVDLDSADEVALKAYGLVNVSSLNVRSGASTSTSKLGMITAGTRVDIIGKSGADWYRVNVSVNGEVKKGYVYRPCITIVEEFNSDSESEKVNENQTNEVVKPVESKSGLVTAQALNIRSKASTSSTKLGLLKKNATVEIIGETDDWYKVNAQLNGKTISGFVYSEYVKECSADTSNDNSVEENTTKDAKYGKVQSNGLNVRTGAGTSYDRVISLPRGTYVVIEGQSSNWYKIKTSLNGKEVSGYVCGDYIRIVSKEEADKGETIINATEQDEYLLACLIYCEARNQPYEGQLAVANVVLNRVRSPKYPDTIKEVIYAPYQFTPARSGSLEKALKTGPLENNLKAAKEALAGNNNVPQFYNFNGYVDTSKVAEYKVIGDHTFYHY